MAGLFDNLWVSVCVGRGERREESHIHVTTQHTHTHTCTHTHNTLTHRTPGDQEQGTGWGTKDPETTLQNNVSHLQEYI